MIRFLLLNPNTSDTTTQMMLGIAWEALDGAASIDGMTAAAGARTITDPAALAIGAMEVERMAGSIVPDALSGVLVAAFGDPGLEAARSRLRVPVTGLAEAAILSAVASGGRFAIVTTTPALDAAIRRRVAVSAAEPTFAGIRYTRSGADGMDNPDRLHDDLLDACEQAVAKDGATTIIIGGGPLAAAARRLRGVVAATLIEPLPAAMSLMLARSQQG